MADISVSYALGRLAFALDRHAEHLLQAQLGISYKRFIFLTVLEHLTVREHHGGVTQHELAVALGYSDPAVSTMLVELVKDEWITIEPSPEHGRKRLVSITTRGATLVVKGRQILDAQFDQLAESANIDTDQLRDTAERLFQALKQKTSEEN